MFSLRRLSTKLLSMGSNLWANSELASARARVRKRRTPQCVKYHFHKYNDKFTDPQRNYAQNFASSCFYNHFQWLISFLFFHRRPHYFYACMNLGTTTIFFLHFISFSVALFFFSSFLFATVLIEEWYASPKCHICIATAANFTSHEWLSAPSNLPVAEKRVSRLATRVDVDDDDDFMYIYWFSRNYY